MALVKIRGSVRVTSPDPEGRYNALDKFGRNKDPHSWASTGRINANRQIYLRRRLATAG
jgi:hypothetical protein